MADRDASGTPDPDPPVSLMETLVRCQNQVAELTMRPADYDRFMEIQDDFLYSVIPYAEYLRQMGVLLDVRTTAQYYRHLRIFLDVRRRAFVGEELWLDNVLCLFPVVLFHTLDLFFYSVRNGDTLRNWVRNPDPERERRLAAQREREARRRQNLRFNMASRDSIRDPDPDLNPGVILLCLFNWCQEQVARIIMQPQHYEAYSSITLELRNGIISYDAFYHRMRVLLRNPSYRALRMWWNVHQLEVHGGMRMLDNPMSRYPLALFVTMTMVIYSVMFGFSLWDNFLRNVRRRDDDDE